LEIDADAFTTYELGEISKALALDAHEHREGPGLQALRKECVQHLAWDWSFRDCWSDADWAAKHKFLRRRVVDEFGEGATCEQAARSLHVMLTVRLAAEEAF
jgi:hypothetical protein